MAKKDNAHFNEKWDDATIYQMGADKQAGMTIKQLAAKYKMTQQQVKYVVYRRLKNENLERGLPIANVALKEAGVVGPTTENVTITVTSAGMVAPDPVFKIEEPPAQPEPVHRGPWATLWHKLFG